MRNPRIFLFDEPLSTLDAQLRDEMRGEIKRLHQDLATTMIYVTHDQIEAMTLADRIAVMKGGVIQQLGTPQEIYSRPVNRFVAGFIGSPGMNFFDGRIARENGAVSFRAEGLDVPLATYDFQRPPEDGQPVALGVRPEHIGMNSGEGWPVSQDVRIEVVEPMGSDTLVWTSFGSQPVSIRVTSERAPDVKDEVTIGFDPLRASIFDAASGERI